MSIRLVKELIVVGKIDGSPSIFGWSLGDIQRRALSLVLVKET